MEHPGEGFDETMRTLERRLTRWRRVFDRPRAVLWSVPATGLVRAVSHGDHFLKLL